MSPPYAAPKAAAIIPAYNEVLGVAEVVSGALEHLSVLVVDDGSTDETAAEARAAGATVISLSPNQGKGAALRAGFRYALDEGCEAVVTLDADGQHDPAEIPQFLELFATRHAHLIIGRRRLRRMPPIRRLANWLGRKAFSWTLGQPIPDNQSGYRLVSRPLMEALACARESGFEFEMEMIVACVQQGYVLEWVPIRTLYTGGGSHIDPFTHLRNFLRFVWRIRRTAPPP